MRRFASLPVVPGLMQWFYPQRLSLENRNILYFTVDTALQGLMMGGVFSFISIFLVRLGASELQASLLTSLPAIVMVLVSVPAGQLVERQQDLVRFTNLVRVFHRGSILVVALLPFVVPHDTLITIIILIWSVKAVSNALLESSWMAVVADVIPPRRRAKVNGTRWIILSVVTAAAVAVFGQILDRLPFPLSYQLVFFISFLGGSAGMIYWSKLHLRASVKPPAVEAPGQSIGQQARAFWQSLKLPAFIRYEATTSVFRLALNMPTALYSIYWIRQLRASDVWIGWHATANQVALIVGYAVWGKVITRKGHRWPLLICAAGIALYPLCTTLIPDQFWLPLVAVIQGFFITGVNLSFFDLLLAVCPEDRRPSYIAVNTMLASLAIFVSPLLGTLVANTFELQTVFYVAGAIHLIAAVLFWRLRIAADEPDPSVEEQMSDASLKASVDYARGKIEAFVEQYKELLRIPSIGADPAYRADVRRAAEWIAEEMQRLGIEHVQVLDTEGQPAVYGDWLHAGEEAPTALLYAHYDVQPVDPLDLWVAPPFEPDIRDGKLYARGVIDDKAGVFLHLKAFESVMAATGSLPINVKFIFEGEEESGSPTMAPFIEAHKALLAADVAVISDGGSSDEVPSMMASVRGIVAAEVRVKGPERDLHSGSFGGVVHNPTHMVGKIVAALHDDEGRIRIPGFYDDVVPVSAAHQALIEVNEPRALAHARKETGLETFWGVPGYTYLERATAQPTCDVNGIFGGYQGAGAKTVLPAEAGFKVSMRLVENQDPDDIVEKFVAFVDSFARDTLKIETRILSSSWPAETLISGPIAQAVVDAYTATWGHAPTMARAGGSVPIIGMLQHLLDIPVVSMGLGHGGNGHSPNEYYDLDYFAVNIDTAIRFLYNLANVPRT
jgi:acetylornithine deacetylase/succinyl-diaminopimelate desuccinylase-like protein/MFS family permease